MALVLVGSARIDENGNACGGKAGDQKQKTNAPDCTGEVSVQEYYLSKQGWRVLRPNRNAKELGFAMLQACNNPNVGYDQYERGGVLKYGTNSKTPTECDCSSLVRQCIKEAMGVDVGNFTTTNEASVLLKSGLFREVVLNKNTLQVGDVLVTRTKGHTVIVVQAAAATDTNTVQYYPKYTGTFASIVNALQTIKVDSSFATRKKIAAANGIKNYTGTAAQNTKMLNLLKQGKLIKA